LLNRLFRLIGDGDGYDFLALRSVPSILSPFAVPPFARCIVAPTYSNFYGTSVSSDQQANAHGGGEIANACCGRFRRDRVIVAALLAQLIDFLGRLFVDTLLGLGIERDQKACEIPARGSLREALFGGSERRLFDDLAGSHQIKPKSINESATNIDRHHPSGPLAYAY
jgi:hypothetical protein